MVMSGNHGFAPRMLWWCGLLGALVGCTEPAGPGVDSIFINASAYTMNADAPWAQAIAVDDGGIVYVGDNEGAVALAGPETVRRDLGGKMLLPGFIDTHVHPVAGGAYAKALSLDTFGGVDDWIRAIDEYAKAHADAPLIFGYGFLASTFGPDGPTRQMIDQVVPDRPVLIMDEGFHGAWANSRALEVLNITSDTPDPAPGFSYYKREADGNPTGYLLEGTAVMAMEGLDAITEDVVVEGTAHVVEVMNRYGVTAAFDAGALDQEEGLPRVLARIAARGDLTLRLVGSSMAFSAEQAATAVDAAEAMRATLKGENYHYRMLKIMDDGTVEGRTAAMFEDYQGEPGNNGETVFTEAELTRMVTQATERDLDVHIHALGERAVHEALNAIEAARAAHSQGDSRYTICHIQVIADRDLPRFAELDVIAQSTPLWASYDTYGKPFVSEDQFNRYWRFKSLRDLGVRLTFGSDFPASGAGLLGLSPVIQIEIGHTRQNPGDPDAPVQPRASERLDVDTLLRGFTIDAAYQLRMEDEIGSLEVGKRADLVVLDQNPFEVDPHSIHEIEVVLTVLGGKVVYDADGA